MSSRHGMTPSPDPTGVARAFPPVMCDVWGSRGDAWVALTAPWGLPRGTTGVSEATMGV